MIAKEKFFMDELTILTIIFVVALNVFSVSLFFVSLIHR